MSDKKIIIADEDEEVFRSIKPRNRFDVWKGRDVWHKDLAVQIRLEPDGSVFLSTQEGHVSTLEVATITLEQLHADIKAIIKRTKDNARYDT